MNQSLSILGSTGSIGTQALDVCRAHNFSVCGLAVYRNIDLLEQQIREFRPKKACVFCEDQYHELKQRVKDCDVTLTAGMEGLCEVASMQEAETTLNAVVGMIGLVPTLEAISAGKKIALANKETLVTGGKLVMEAAAKKKVPILPVDSEHSAIFQALQGNRLSQVKRILLTASGGPFFGKTKEDLKQVTVKEALAHPNWSMGAKITIDSATLMNKGLELIEAMWLFDQAPTKIQIVVHRESVVHSAVEYVDHSVIAQMGVPDMKIPIQYALTYPERCECPVEPLDLFSYGTLTFKKPDLETFDCLRACLQAAQLGGLYPAAVNGANEQAVALFLEGKISFLQIGELVLKALDVCQNQNNFTVEDIINTDRAMREFVLSYAEQ
ncbi:MAG: 1-deoxy-D-xylulose-5-phosphate reductoisomerase [Massiliimalia sp.]